MKIKNKYAYNSKLSEAKFRKIIKYFVLDYDACKISILINTSRNTVNKYLLKIRERISYLSSENYFLAEILDLDLKKISENKEKAKNRIKAKIDLSRKNIEEIVKEKFRKDRKAIINKINAYLEKNNDIPHTSYIVKKVINNNKYFITNWKNIRLRLTKFRGVSKRTFYLHIKECEFKYNHRKENLYLLLLEIFRKEPLNLS